MCILIIDSRSVSILQQATTEERLSQILYSDYESVVQGRKDAGQTWYNFIHYIALLQLNTAVAGSVVWCCQSAVYQLNVYREQCPIQ